MNCLPVGPHSLDTPEKMERYFADLKRWNFDIPYNAFYAHPLRLLLGKWKEVHLNFTRRARELGLPPCIQIQTTVALAEDVPIEGNAQYYADNTPDIREHTRKKRQVVDYFASFASRQWRDFLKQIIAIFRSYGYEWLVLEEPMLRTDIPGTKDPLYQVFCQRYPGRQYPLHLWDSEEYYLLQRLKRDVLVEFYLELTNYARAASFKMIGCMPWFFTPTCENTPWETWNSCCDQGRLAYLPEMDFLVVRMQPDNLLAEVCISEHGEALPRQAYVETMAHHFGKPVIAVNNPTNEHNRPDEVDTLIPFGFFAPYTLAAAAASPCGMTRHWYGQNYGKDLRHMELMTEVNAILPRLSTPLSPYAVVFSYAGVERILPRGWRQTWQHYFSLTSQLIFREGIPVHTLFAESLEQQLKNFPEVKCIFLLPFFPLPPAEVDYLKHWIKKATDRWLIFLGAHNGYTWDLRFRQTSVYIRPNEVVQLFGIDNTKSIKVLPFSRRLRLVSQNDSIARKFWGKRCELYCAGFPEFHFNNRDINFINVIYTTENGSPVVFEKSYGKTAGKALFVGCSLDGITPDFPLRQLLNYLGTTWELWNKDSLLTEPISVLSSERCPAGPDSILWNLSRTGYLIVSNLDTQRGRIKVNLNPDKWQLWDIKQQKFLTPAHIHSVEGHSIRCFRLVNKDGSLLDVQGQIYLDRITESPTSATIYAYFRPELTLFTRRKISQITQAGTKLHFVSQKKNSYYLTDVIGIKLSNYPIKIDFSA